MKPSTFIVTVNGTEVVTTRDRSQADYLYLRYKRENYKDVVLTEVVEPTKFTVLKDHFKVFESEDYGKALDFYKAEVLSDPNLLLVLKDCDTTINAYVADCPHCGSECELVTDDWVEDEDGPIEDLPVECMSCSHSVRADFAALYGTTPLEMHNNLAAIKHKGLKIS